MLDIDIATATLEALPQRLHVLVANWVRVAQAPNVEPLTACGEGCEIGWAVPGAFVLVAAASSGHR